jgi:hypothetical protein
MIRFNITVICFGLTAGALAAAELKPQTVQAFDDYTRRLESRIEGQLKGPAFLWSDQEPSRNLQLRQGRILAESVTGDEPLRVPDGLVHDWVGAVFIPRATLGRVLNRVQDYDHHKDVYAPEVIRSQLIRRDGNDFSVYLRLVKKKFVVTVVLDTYYDVQYLPIDPARCYARSRSSRILQVDDAGQPGERQLPAGRDGGYLWRLNSYWRYAERDGGVYMECEAVSLTRGIPPGTGLFIGGIVRDLPRDSLTNTLRKTREALAGPSR